MKDSRPLAQITRWLLIAAFGAGIALRLHQYFFNISLSDDEAGLAINLIQRSFSGLMRPLDFVETAPILFSFLEKIAVMLFGWSEYALRLFPLCFGILALFLFYPVSKRFLNRQSAALAFILFALSFPLIYYSAQVKQYSSDLVVILCLYLLVFRLKSEKFNLIQWLFLTAAGVIFIFLSDPAVFELTGFGLILFVYFFKRKELAQIQALGLAAIACCAAFAVNYFLFAVHLAHNTGLVSSWEPSFVRSGNLIQIFVHLFHYGPVSVRAYRLGGAIFIVCCYLLMIAGCFLMYRQNRFNLGLLLSPLLFTLIASAFKKYPFHGRLLLFMVPAALMLIAAGMDAVRVKRWGSVIYPSFVIAFLVGNFFIKPPIAEIRPVLQYLQAHRKPDERLYVYYGAHPAYDYYCDYGGINCGQSISGISARDNWPEYEKDLSPFVGEKRVWFLFSHVFSLVDDNEEKFDLRYLNGHGKVLNSFQAPGAAVFLYDLRDGNLDR